MADIAVFSPQGTAGAVLFDFGGVLTASVLDSFADFSRRVTGDPRLVMDLLTEDPGAKVALVDHEEGRIEQEEFEDALAASLRTRGHEIDPRGIVSGLQAGLHRDDATISLVAHVRAAGIPVALVSNSLGRDCYVGYDLAAMFDAVVISGVEGVRKPSAQLYRIAAERLGVAPETCLMVDDLSANIVAAHRLGMGGIVHRDATSTALALGGLLGSALAWNATTPAVR